MNFFYIVFSNLHVIHMWFLLSMVICITHVCIELPYAISFIIRKGFNSPLIQRIYDVILYNVIIYDIIFTIIVKLGRDNVTWQYNAWFYNTSLIMWRISVVMGIIWCHVFFLCKNSYVKLSHDRGGSELSLSTTLRGSKSYWICL